MFRLTRFMHEVLEPGATPHADRTPSGPVVIWNLTRRCNLTCKHCYAWSADHAYPGELSTEETLRVLDDLRAAGVPALVLSGGEPLLRPDLDAIASRAKAIGFHVGLSTNGTLIDAPRVRAFARVGYDYVGISIDGRRATHDRFRRRIGAFDASLAGMRLARDAGLRVGLRLTLTEDNRDDLPWLLDLMEAEGIDRFYLSHLNYAGRGERLRSRDARHAATRSAMTLLFERCLAAMRAGRPLEIVTGNNDADGVYFLHWVADHFPERTDHARRLLERWGGNATGVNVANIDNLGNVHADTYWWDHTLGNLRERSFAAIWNDSSDPILAGLKARPRRIGGRCGACAYFAICNGNTRVRARSLTGDPWAEDPGCYLDDAEIGLPPEPQHVAA